MVNIYIITKVNKGVQLRERLTGRRGFKSEECFIPQLLQVSL